MRLMKNAKVKLAKRFMKLAERRPPPPDQVTGELQEVFCHDSFLKADDQKRAEIMRASSLSKYVSEVEYPWDGYFGFALRPFLEGKSVLDLGCFNGGRGVAWFERYGILELSGIDTDPVYIEAAQNFANCRGINAEFRVGTGETIPFDDDAFEAILTFDVFEHVQDLQTTLHECQRVLKPGGHIFAVFPSYFHPVEHHLSLVSRTPFLQLMFSGQTLVEAYCEIINERGENDAAWYGRPSRNLDVWERCNTINGTTYRRFTRLVRETGLVVVRDVHKPVLSIGRLVANRPIIRRSARLLTPLTYVPGLQEVFLHRITFVLGKPAV